MRKSRYIRLTAAASLAVLALTACGSSTSGGSDPSGSSTNAAGTPVKGGSLTILQSSEPRSLDPQIVSNQVEGALGNALYGALFTSDLKTNKAVAGFGESIETTDTGQTWTVKLKPGILYSDGSPMTAADIKFNWEHAADPATGSGYAGDARTIKTITVVDDLTITVGLVAPNILFPALIWESNLTYIGKPSVTKQGQAVIDAHPIGAGPFILKEWRRQDVISLVRNDKYFDARKPYLDAINIRTIKSTVQRYDTLVSGGADLSMDGDFQSMDKAKKAGLNTIEIETAGGVGLAFNTVKAPFDDLRARLAISAALDLQLLSDASTDGKSPVPATMFIDGTPYYEDIPLHKKDPVLAQKLFDELAAEGKPLNFTFTITSASAKPLADSIQTQLGAFKNVKMSVATVDFSQYGTIIVAQRQFDMIQQSISENRMWRSLSGKSQSSYTKISDPEMTAALDRTQVKATDDELKAAYKAVQERFVATMPYIMYTRQGMGAIGNNNVGGISLYGNASLQPENLWKK